MPRSPIVISRRFGKKHTAFFILNIQDMGSSKTAVNLYNSLKASHAPRWQFSLTVIRVCACVHVDRLNILVSKLVKIKSRIIIIHKSIMYFQPCNFSVDGEPFVRKSVFVQI
jgi:hypothetical protein